MAVEKAKIMGSLKNPGTELELISEGQPPVRAITADGARVNVYNVNNITISNVYIDGRLLLVWSFVLLPNIYLRAVLPEGELADSKAPDPEERGYNPLEALEVSNRHIEINNPQYMKYEIFKGKTHDTLTRVRYGPGGCTMLEYLVGWGGRIHSFLLGPGFNVLGY